MIDDLRASGSDIFRIHLGTLIAPGKMLLMLRDTAGLALNHDFECVVNEWETNKRMARASFVYAKRLIFVDSLRT